jgi:hypothetical protein
MHKNSNDRHSDRNGKPQAVERVGADLPYPPATTNAVEQLRKLLATLIVDWSKERTSGRAVRTASNPDAT